MFNSITFASSRLWGIYSRNYFICLNLTGWQGFFHVFLSFFLSFFPETPFFLFPETSLFFSSFYCKNILKPIACICVLTKERFWDENMFIPEAKRVESYHMQTGLAAQPKTNCLVNIKNAILRLTNRHKHVRQGIHQTTLIMPTSNPHLFHAFVDKKGPEKHVQCVSL